MTEHLRRVSSRASSASIRGRYEALLQTHGRLEEQLKAEMSRPGPDDDLVRQIKKRKLRIKDELAGIERLLDAIGADIGRERSPAVVIPLSAVRASRRSQETSSTPAA